MIRYFRRYEKWIFWGIVIVILPTFSVSWVMMDVLSRRDRPSPGTLFGKTVKADEFDLARTRYLNFLRVRGQEQSYREEMIWDHLAFLAKAEAAGIDVSDEELSEAVNQLYRQMEAQARAVDRVRQEAKPGDPDWKLQSQYQKYFREELPLVEFDHDRYEKMIRERGATSPGDFERTLREQLKIQKLMGIVAESTKVAPEKLYEQYQEENHKRKARYVAFPAEKFAITDPAKVTDDELKAYYGRNEERFREPKKVAVEYVAAPLAAFESQVAAPTEQELTARYEQVKEARYRLPDARPPAPAGTATAETPTATAAPLARYKPFAEARAELERDIRRERVRDMARKRIEEVRAKVAADLEAGKKVDLEALAKAEGLSYGKTPLVEQSGLLDVKPIAHFTTLRTADQLAPGAISESAANEEDAFFLRVLEKTPERLPPYDEIAEKVRESYTKVLDDEVRQYYNRNIPRYREPEKAEIEYLALDYARFEKQVPESVTGTARHDALRKKAEERIDEVKKAADEPDAGGKRRDLEAVALEKGVASGTLVVEKSGANLPPEVKSPDLIARLAANTDKAGELSPTFENEAKTGVLAYRVKRTIASKTPPLDEVKDRVRKDILADRAWDRARDAAEKFSKDVSPKSPLVPAAEKLGLEVKETPLIGRHDAIEGVGNSTQLVLAIFRLRELGETGGPIYDEPGKTAYVYRWIAKEAADPAGFAAKEKDLRDEMRMDPARMLEWQQAVRLEARSIKDDALERLYKLRYGPDGLASIEARQIFIALDAKTIEERLTEKAKAEAEQVLAQARAGTPFDELANRWSQDEGTRKRGGDLGFFGRGRMVPEFEQAAFAANVGDIVGPVKSKFGYHLIQVVAKRGEEIRARHILFRAERRKDKETGELEPLDPETRKLALAKSREKAEKAMARLQAGEDFEKVAQDLTDEPGSGEKRSYEYQTPFEQMVFALKPQELSSIYVDEEGGAHLVLTEPWRGAGQDRFSREGGAKSLLVREIYVRPQNAKRLEKIRAELLDYRARLESGEEAMSGRTPWGDFVRKFEAYAKEESEAPSAAWGGKIGVFEPDPDLEKYGPNFRDTLYALQDGAQSGIIDVKEGLSILKVVERKKKTFAEARSDVADALLQGVEF
jgi:parvulin-like peptidyl-prolyl isomerase